jgi:hypothetical protein
MSSSTVFRTAAAEWDVGSFAKQIKAGNLESDGAGFAPKQLLQCMLYYCFQVASFFPEELFDDLLVIAVGGYQFARELLGSVGRQPTYYVSESKLNQQSQAISDGTVAWERDRVAGALGTDLVRSMLAIPRQDSNALRLVRESQGREVLVGTYVFGGRCAMSEEAIFGPF